MSDGLYQGKMCQTIRTPTMVTCKSDGLYHGKMCQTIGAMTLDKSRSIGLWHVTPCNFSSWTLTICLWHVKLSIFGADHWTLRSHHITGTTYIQWMISCSYFHVKCTCTYTMKYQGILTLELDHWNVLAKDNINKRHMVINTCWITIII